MADRRAIFVSMVVEPLDDGFLASVPDLQGAFGEGDTMEEAVCNCMDVVKLIVPYRKERGEPLGFNEVPIGVTTRMTVSLPLAVG